ncbi:hypothetical protein GCM10011611_47560 [Aliidongia dinghuensis]|uniref:Peptidoglycan binding-like domain-containing protein n=1 Tax=Aliidongia dinghuensis TaxID=1867774 RepID=A0A8J3E766_9PROT|nr:peptidoglycan-binding domain-containing protein [Aliidongia dinghuensis]GGF35711.1 hypothetical protein GCM10011611_47560 [Aliidongia dinghuensis]
MGASRLLAAALLVTLPSLGFAQGTVPESALVGPTFSMQPGSMQPGANGAQAPQVATPNQNVLGNSGVQAAPTLKSPPVAPGTPGALIPKRPMGTVTADDPVRRAYVQSLQEQLPAHGYRPGPVTGRLDAQTERAIRAYQRDAGITPNVQSAYVLKQTLDSVSFARPPIQAAAGPAVNRAGGGSIAFVQRSLAAKGYDPGPADGKLGARTVNAIKQFQGDRGLPRDGKVTPQLLGLLGKA